MGQTRHRGFTLVELMVVVALIVVLISLSAPSIRRLIDTQRVNSTNSQLVTDLQFARSEAASRNALVRVTFGSNATVSCYTIYTYNPNIASNLSRCDCLASPVCAVAGSTEIRTTRVPSDTGVKVTVPANRPDEFAFDPVTGSLYKIPSDKEWDPLDRFIVNTRISDELALRTMMAISGRPTVCAPPLSKMRTPAC
jgi:type IV fimbrial biogenesis protein FimT